MFFIKKYDFTQIYVYIENTTFLKLKRNFK